jgi:hypothetical protein
VREALGVISEAHQSVINKGAQQVRSLLHANRKSAGYEILSAESGACSVRRRDREPEAVEIALVQELHQYRLRIQSGFLKMVVPSRRNHSGVFAVICQPNAKLNATL